MAYSLERLAKAQALFQRGANDFWLPQMTGPYLLRNRVSKRAGILASWHDNEQDEDYDPFNEGNEKPKLHFCPDDDPDSSPSKKVKVTSLTSRLPSKPDDKEHDNNDHDAKADIDNGNDFKNSDLSSFSSSEDSESDIWDRYWAVSSTTAITNSRYRLRPRGKYAVPDPLRSAITASNAAAASVLPSHTQTTEKEVPLRGCNACQGLGLECSLATNPDPLAYPCTECALDGIECEVTPEPEWKRSCEGCRCRHGEFCSYRFADYDHSQPCQQCINRGFKCVAGPAKYQSLLFRSDGTSSSEQSFTPLRHTRQLRSSLAIKTQSIEVVVISDDDSEYMTPSGPNSVAHISDSLPQQVSSAASGKQPVTPDQMWDFYWHK
jgi:hypothetical protein